MEKSFGPSSHPSVRKTSLDYSTDRL